MELSFESAFSTGGFVGHISYILLIISMLMRNMIFLRLLVVCSAISGILYSWLWLKDPVGIFWESLLLSSSLLMLVITNWKNASVKFTEQERAFVEGSLANLPAYDARKLLDCGEWISEKANVLLVREGVPAEHLYHVSSGNIEISRNGIKLANCNSGDFIGEMTIQTNEPATASATVMAPSQLWAIRKSSLQNLLEKNEAIASELDRSFSDNYRSKITAANTVLMNEN